MTQRKMIEPKVWPWYDHKRYSFCMAAQKGDYLFFSGNTASEFDPATKRMVCKGDIVDQTGVNYEKVKLLLESAGGNMDDIVKITDYVTPSGIEKYPQLVALRRKYFKDSRYPAGTSLVVNHLLRPDAFIEVECVAVLGKSEKKVINPGWPDDGSFSYPPAVQKGDLLFISGQVGIDYRTGKIVDHDDLIAQTNQAYQNIQTILDVSGATFNDIVKTIDYVAPGGIAKHKDTERVRAKFFKGNYSAHTAVVVYQNLPKEALIKVEATAVVGHTKKEMYDLGLGKRYEGLTHRPIVKKGKLIALSGVVSIDLETGKLVSGDVVAQMRQVLKNAEKILGAAGMGWNDVLMAVDSVVPEAEAAYRGTADVRHEFFKGALPPSTGIIQNKLVGVEGLLISVDFMAAHD
jgi:enamine deaminase RidA (YjgF/YER057c/UK114 family)